MIKVKNLSKEFIMHIRDSAVIDSFEDVSFDVNAGQLLAITGPSGAGKSSLLKCIYRTYLPTKGQILYNQASGGSVDLAQLSPREIIKLRHSEIGYVSQFLHVLPRVSALEVLKNPLMLRGWGEKEAEEVAKRLLAHVGLGEILWNMYPSTFSGGEKQRLNILHAIITRPRFLLLDEPTASLDAGYKGKVMDLIIDLKKSGTCMIGVFHDKDALEVLSDIRYDLCKKEYCAVCA